jgi:hypothetical protein
MLRYNSGHDGGFAGPRFAMAHAHHAHHAQAASPTASLLRMSAAQRLAGAAAVIGGLWALVAWAMAS